MTPNGSVHEDGGSKVSFQRNTPRLQRAATALIVSLATCVWAGTAKAEGATPTTEASAREALSRVAKIELLASATFAPHAVGLLGFGLEGVYMATPHYGVGVAAEAFYVDTLEYPDDGSLKSGYHGVAFVEGDLLPGIFTPYARIGLGLGDYQRSRHYFETESELNLVAQATAGVALRGGPFLFRLSASPSLYGKDFVLACTAGLGARF